MAQQWHLLGSVIYQVILFALDVLPGS